MSEIWCGCRELHPDVLRGREVFSLLNYSRSLPSRSSEREQRWSARLRPDGLRRCSPHSAPAMRDRSEGWRLKGPGAFLILPAHAISTKNKHLLVIYSIPARGFTAAVSVFRGTPPTKPFDCKIWFRHSSALSRDRWADPSGGKPRFSRARFRFVPGDILKMPLCSYSQCRCLSLLLVSSCSLHG